MTPEHTALVEQLHNLAELCDWDKDANKELEQALTGAIAAIRALAGEVEALKIDNQTLRDLLAVVEERNEL